jgi:hypothetical protein
LALGKHLSCAIATWLAHKKRRIKNLNIMDYCEIRYCKLTNQKS